MSRLLGRRIIYKSGQCESEDKDYVVSRYRRDSTCNSKASTTPKSD